MQQIKNTLATKLISAIEEITENETIEDVLKWLIQDSDLMEVVSTLDVIANQDHISIKMYDIKGDQIFPVIAR